MKTTKKNKAGFTLVELMVVAIIVAILAAVAVPLMSGNTARAMATEAQAGCSTVATAMRVYRVQNGAYANPGHVTNLPGIGPGDANGTYFDEDNYVISGVSGNNFTITATSRSSSSEVPDELEGKTLIMTVTDGVAAWSGDLY